MNLRIRKTMLLTSVLALFALVLAACGTSPAPAAQPAVQAAAQVNVKLETNPNPAKAGDAELLLNLTDQNGSPIEGAKVDVSATHPDMNGMSMGGQASDQGKGEYSIKANFNMGGNWTIIVQVHKDGLDVRQELPLEVK